MRLSIRAVWILSGCAGCATSAPAPRGAGLPRPAVRAVARRMPPRPVARHPAPPRPDQRRVQAGAWPLRVTLAPEQRRFMVGEPVYLTFRVTNLSGTDLYLAVGGHQRNALGRWGRYRVRVQDAQGHFLPVVSAGPGFGGWSWSARLPAGGTFERELFLPNWARIARPGRYRIHCERTLNLVPFGAPPPPRGARRTTDLTVHLWVGVQVTPARPVAMARLIVELEGLALGTRYRIRPKAMRALTAIRDPQVVPTLVRASRSSYREVRLAAIRALGRFRTAAALQGLRECVGRPQVATRQTCAQTLAKSPHPGAAAVLRRMGQDPDASVRLTVLHHLGKHPCGKDRPAVQAYLKDPSDLVRKEAKRYLSGCRGK